MNNPLVVIVGPTCVGKTEVSVYLAERLKGEIISADSRTFYKGMDIGTAKPSQEILQKIPHHLVDVAEPDNQLNLAIFQRLARSIIVEILSRNHLPFLVGGTGQYIRAVTRNWAPPEILPDLRLRQILEDIAISRGKEYLHHALTILDPEAASRIDHRNIRRTIRAMEVILKTGHRFSSQRAASLSPYDLISVGLTRPRTELYSRIDQRIDDMFANGFIDEVRILLDAGFPPELPSFSAIGYPECISVITGKLTEKEAIEEIKRKTRIFVRRQANWFKPTDPNIKWFDLSNQSFTEIVEYIRSSLKP